MARMASITRSISASSAEKSSAGSYSGHAEIMMDSPSCGRVCQISSVMNGMNGCRSLSVLLMT